jgi:hypothetical protein
MYNYNNNLFLKWMYHYEYVQIWIIGTDIVLGWKYEKRCQSYIISTAPLLIRLISLNNRLTIIIVSCMYFDYTGRFRNWSLIDDVVLYTEAQ